MGSNPASSLDRHSVIVSMQLHPGLLDFCNQINAYSLGCEVRNSDGR